MGLTLPPAPPAPPALLPSPALCGRQDRKGCLCFAEMDQQAEETDQGQQAQTPVTTSPSASSTTSFMSSSLEDTTTATTPVTDTETVPASESPGVLPLSLLRYLLVFMPRCFAVWTARCWLAGWPCVNHSFPVSPKANVLQLPHHGCPSRQTGTDAPHLLPADFSLGRRGQAPVAHLPRLSARQTCQSHRWALSTATWLALNLYQLLCLANPGINFCPPSPPYSFV